MVDEAQIRMGPWIIPGRDGLEMSVYLSVILIALVVGLEQSLDTGEELLLIWGTSIGLTLAHIFAFRLASVYALGVSFTSGWRPIGAIVLAAFAVGATASIPYLGWLDIASPSTVTIWMLMLIVGVAAYLAARSRGWSLAGTLGLYVDDSRYFGISFSDQVSVDPLSRNAVGHSTETTVRGSSSKGVWPKSSPEDHQ